MISILLPVKNESEYICDCLDSILLQSFTNWELIIIDDHSEDDTVAKIKSHPIFTRNTRLITAQGKGLISALQSGWAHVLGKYITRMDGDDKMPKNKLKFLYNNLSQQKQPTVVTGLVRYFPREGLSEGYQTYEKWLNHVQINQSHHQMMYRECVFASPNWMMKTSDLKSIGAFHGLKYPEDYALALKCYQAGFRFNAIKDLTHHWRHHRNRMSLKHHGYTQKAFFDLKINHWIKHKYKKYKPLLIWGDNSKTRITTHILKENKITYELLKESEVEKTKEFHSPQLLIAVYPKSAIRKTIRKFLTELDMVEGNDYWFL